jgi:hypothetical protein
MMGGVFSLFWATLHKLRSAMLHPSPRHISHLQYLDLSHRKGTSLARRVLQFPVRNAFAVERLYDSLALNAENRAQDRKKQPHRISVQVENEISNLVARQSTGRNGEFEAARLRSVVVLRPTSRIARLRKRFAAMPSSVRAFTAKLIRRP